MDSTKEVGTADGPEDGATATSTLTTDNAVTAENKPTEITATATTEANATAAETETAVPDAPVGQDVPTTAAKEAEAMMPETVAETRESTVIPEGLTGDDASVPSGGEPIVVQLLGCELLGKGGSMVRTSTIWDKVIGELLMPWSLTCI